MKYKLWIGGLVLVLAAGAGTAKADGMIIPWHPQQVVTETDQRAVVWWDGSKESLTVSITFSGNADKFVWIVPVPGKPDVKAGTDELFTSLSDLTAPQVNDNMPVPMGTFNGLGAMGTSQKAPVQVIETKKVDIYDIAVLTATDTQALAKWLTDNGFPYPDTREYLLKSYVNRGWYFVAAKIDTQSLGYAGMSLRQGHATPLSLTFPTKQAVFPLKISGPEDKSAVISGALKDAWSFEQGTEDWYSGMIVKGEAKDGSWAIRVTNSTQTVGNNYAYTSLGNVESGKRYVLSAYLKAVPGTTQGWAKLRVSGGGMMAESPAVSLGDWTTSWKRLELPFTVGSNMGPQLSLLMEQTTPGTQVLWDAVQLEEGSTATPFKGEILPKSSYNFDRPMAADQPVDLLVYVFSNHKQMAPGFSTDYAGTVDSKTITNLAMDDNGQPWIKAGKSMYLTRFSRNMLPAEMTSDVWFRNATDNNPVGGGREAGLTDRWLRVTLGLVVPILLEAGVIAYIGFRRYRHA